MPTPFTSTFATAAASGNGESTGNRRDGTGGGDWSRTRVNGATQTFRRPSLATNNSHTRDNTQTSSNVQSPGVYIPPHLNSNYSAGGLRNGGGSDTRYTKEQLLSVFQSQKEAGILDRNLETLFLGSWNPLNTKTGAADDNSRSEGKDQPVGPEICWNHRVESEPFGLVSMTEEEKQLFSSVNSPIKLSQNNAKENNSSGGIGARKASLSSYTNASTSSSRPGTRRREPSESFSTNGPLSPSEGKGLFRNESNAATPPPALLRRRTDFKEDDISTEQKEDGTKHDDSVEQQSGVGTLRRTGTAPGPVGSNNSATSPWSAGPQSSGFGSMGTFGSFAIGNSQSSSDSPDKRPGFGSARGSSRFKDLLSKASSEDIGSTAKDKGPFGPLEKLPEEEGDSAQSRLKDMFKTRPARSETNPYDDAPARTGSAALSSTQDNAAPAQSVENFGFSSFGAPGMRDTSQADGGIHHTPHGRFNPQEPMSPTNTNPYQSPHGNQAEEDDHENNESGLQSSAFPPFGAGRRNMFPGMDDRGVPLNVTTQRNANSFGGLSGFGGLGGQQAWSSAGLGSGTPARDRGLGGASPFGDPIFSPLADLQSPGSAGVGAGFFGSHGFGSIGRGSRLGAMFPPAMQEQMRGDNRPDTQGIPFETRPESAQRDPFDGRRREENIARGGSSFDESNSARGIDESDPAFSQPAHIGTSTLSGQQPNPAGPPGPGQRTSTGTEPGQPSQSLSQSSGSNSSNQMPAAQQRQMVMPDRMRWIYRDPQGNVQGPWSGLEMHDWFKAGFFTAELQVKKLEDSEYEPLAQLVRRIGNSREPFLVPQIGVPHGPPTVGQGNSWANTAIASNGTAQPPFASSFPSFGTTLTAEQQNALERRKQEEQFLMARQKEHLAQQQILMKQMQIQNGPHGMHSLQHHSSAHSLHSQPSFGSITSPSGYQSSSIQAPIQPPGQHLPGFGPPPTSAATQQPFSGEQRSGREDELPGMMDRMTFSQRANFPFGGGPLGGSGDISGPNSQVATMLQDRGRLQQQQPGDMRQHQEAFLGPQGQNDRLEEFHQLRGQLDSGTDRSGPDAVLPTPIGAPRVSDESAKPPVPIGQGVANQNKASPENERLSLAQQVQRTAAANSQAAVEADWKQTDVIKPPPTSISPLPAPAAQRNRQHVADALAAESRSASQTPIETPSTSIAPWADRSNEVSKGPSLKEIQEAEAKRAAEQEELLAAARRAQAEQERLALAQVPVPAPGLPSSSTWAASTSPGTPTTPGASVWGSKSAVKSGATPTNSAKKTLAQIQKEEESRKQRAAAAAAATIAANPPTSASSATAVVGKRYAELASKIGPSPPAGATVGGAWTTVGSGGKAKTPAAVVATPQQAIRTVSATAVTPGKPRPTIQPSRSTTTSSGQNKATEEFTKWIKGALAKGLNSNINLDSFVQDLLMLPPEVEIISDSVYASSQTLDGRRFAEEFVRRRKLADKGVVEPAANATQVNMGVDNKAGAGGWSEVAKKNPPAKEESNSAFKVVATKKKGKR